MVLSGFPNYPGTQIIRIGFFLTNLLTRARGPMYHSKLVQQLSVGNFNKQIKHAKTEVDWICSDEQVVQAYLKDPYCGHGFRDVYERQPLWYGCLPEKISDLH